MAEVETTSKLLDVDALTAAFGGSGSGGAEAAASKPVEDLPPLEYEPMPVDLPGGWRLRPWKQRHLMAIMEDNILQKKAEEFPTGWHRNYAVVAAVIKADGFEMPTGVKVEMLDDMHWRDVAELREGIMAHYYNVVLTPKN